MATPNPAGLGNAFDVPLELRANDITRHSINIDSRFRTNPRVSSTTNFYYRLQAPVKNILRIRVTAVEFPTRYFFFTEQRKNVTLRIIYDRADPKTFVITIPDGNYTADQMTAVIESALLGNPIDATVAYDPTTETYTFTANQYFAVDTTYESYRRYSDYGLGFYLGFPHKANRAVVSPTDPASWSVSSSFCANFTGDSYVFLKVNDFDCVSQQTEDQAFTAMAKIVIGAPCCGDRDDHSREVVFPNPLDLTRFQIQILDAYGNLLDLCGANVSFTLEVLEVKNLTLYNTVRDALSLRYV
jgi:hypothetical protein